MDALRWLFSYDAPDDDHDGCCWGPNGLDAAAGSASRSHGRRAHRAVPPKTWLGRRDFGDVVASADIEDDAAWLARWRTRRRASRAEAVV